MNLSTHSTSGYSQNRPSAIVPLTDSERSQLEDSKSKSKRGMMVAALGLAFILAYRFLFTTLRTEGGIAIAIVAVIGLVVFYLVFKSRINKALERGTKHVGRARIVKKYISGGDDGSGGSPTFRLDWDFNKTHSKVYVPKDIYAKLSENDLADIEVVSTTHYVLSAQKVAESGSW
ncbi:hypothetical protein [Salmonirosea aquatica]|uniref:Uncharacterized protein n=1 Tax=Salmonirosea aquatica TaxID=2654236 RepID=A0A7C9FZ63_9BACT|nr:hypothetical protein [Cytophagaceae bacterium SJW1-29]